MESCAIEMLCYRLLMKERPRILLEGKAFPESCIDGKKKLHHWRAFWCKQTRGLGKNSQIVESGYNCSISCIWSTAEPPRIVSVVRNPQVAFLLARESSIVDNASVFKTKTMKISIFRLADVDGDDAGLDTRIISYNLISKTFCDSPLLHTCCQR